MAASSILRPGGRYLGRSRGTTRQDHRQPHRSGSTRITYAVLSLAFILTATSPCTAQTSALWRVPSWEAGTRCAQKLDHSVERDDPRNSDDPGRNIHSTYSNPEAIL